MRNIGLLVICLFLICSCGGDKQIKEKITGTWVIDEMIINRVSSTAEKMGNPQYQFHADGKYYVFHAGQNEEGNWKIGRDSSMTLTSITYNDKPPQECKIKKIDDKNFWYKSRAGKWRVEVHLKRY